MKAFTITLIAAIATVSILHAGLNNSLKPFDTDGDDALSPSEAKASQKEFIVKHFAAIDSNSDGKVTQAELEAYWHKNKK
ncbi:MAG TPA: hypothetical protein DCX06_13220 [Opitutae bacterium]|nr:hypothetical protein [Opitutae bacterium]